MHSVKWPGAGSSDRLIFTKNWVTQKCSQTGNASAHVVEPKNRKSLLLKSPCKSCLNVNTPLSPQKSGGLAQYDWSKIWISFSIGAMLLRWEGKRGKQQNFVVFPFGVREAKSVNLPRSINSGYKCGIIQLSVHFRYPWSTTEDGRLREKWFLVLWKIVDRVLRICYSGDWKIDFSQKLGESKQVKLFLVKSC